MKCFNLAAALVVAVFAATGCASSDDRPATWTYVHAAVIQPNCTTSACHSSASAAAGLNFDSREGAYAMLTGRVCDAPPQPGDPPRNHVAPFEPEASRLLYLLRGQDVSRRMPPDIALPDVEIELVERWILDGAACD